MLRLHTFGGCILERDGARLDALSGQRKGLALLAVLAAAGANGVSRDTLLGYLWPERDEERARTSLRQLVHALRTQLSPPDLLLPGTELRLNPEAITTDVADFHEAMRRGELDRAVELHAAPFLDGFYLKGSDGFERWVATERAALAHEAADALHSLAERADARGDHRTAIALWRRLAVTEPLSARAALGLMRALDAAGERAAALKHAQVHELLLREEVGGPPDRSVVQLATRLRESPAPAQVLATARADHDPAPSLRPSDLHDVPPAPPRRRGRAYLLSAAGLLLAIIVATFLWQQRGASASAASARGATACAGPLPASVAVLPFANISGNPADEHLSDGLTDELIGKLGKIRGLKVTGRTSSFAVRGRTLDVRVIAETLGVATVLEGSWRRVGDRLKVSAQLVSANDGSVIWAESYDRALQDILAVQEDVAQAIVTAIRRQLAGGRDGEDLRPTTADPEAYELYLKGRYVLETRTGRDGTLRAVEYFEQAVARDSSYARAWSGLSDAYSRLAIFGYGAPATNFASAKTAARRALALDSTLAEAHVALAHIRVVADFEWRAAEEQLRRAIALDPNYAFARVPLAVCYMSQGRLEEAIAHLDTARLIDPLSAGVGNLLGRSYVSAHRPDDAIRTLRRMLELNPQLDLAYQQLAHAYLQKGRSAEAIAAMRSAAALSGRRDSAQLAYVYGVTGNRDEARRVLDALFRPPPRDAALAFHYALAYAGVGERDSAFHWLERGFAERTSFMVGVKAETAFEALHEDARWAALLRRMDLAP